MNNKDSLNENYLLGKPRITDFEYDQLNIPKEASSIKSMKAVYTDEDVRRLLATFGDFEWFLEPKLDGMTAVATYKQGILEEVVTKGSTGNSRTITTSVSEILPGKLDSPVDVTVRGELIIRKENFKEEFSSIRSAVCGAVLCQDGINVVRERCVEFVAFNFQTTMFSGALDAKKYFSNYFTVVETLPSVDLHLGVDYLMSQTNIAGMRYPCDGIVVKVNSYEAQQYLGSTQTEDRWLFAVKPYFESLSTEVVDIDYRVSKHGRNIPVLVVSPVTFLHTTSMTRLRVCRVAVGSISLLEQRSIGISSIVSIKLASSAIPCLDSVLSAAPFVKPVSCISCRCELVDLDLCTNPLCPQANESRLVSILRMLKLSSITRRTINLLVGRGHVDVLSWSQLSLEYLRSFLTEKQSTLVFEQFAQLSISAQNVIFALSIPGVSASVVRRIRSSGISDIGELKVALEGKPFLGSRTSQVLSTALQGLPPAYDQLKFV